MSSLNLHLPDHLKTFADQRAAQMGFPNASAYVESLLAKEEQRQQSLAQLESELVRGLDSGEPIEVSDEYWRAKKADLAARRSRDGGKK
jgi:antitoxin ParD1/3/4